MKTIILFLKYVIYYLVTADERHCYSMGKIKGMHCEGYNSDGFGGRIYKYNPNKTPFRDYLTWKEFKENNK